jgi:hypothetical protein
MAQMVTNASGHALSDLRHEAIGVAIAPALTSIMLSRRDLLEEYNRVMDMFETEAARPLWEQGPSEADMLVEQWAASWLHRVQKLPMVLLMPALGKIGRRCELTIAERDTALTVIALHAHRLRHGSWPTRLEDLVPEHLPLVPRDRFTGGPLRYRVTDGAPLVYSVGADLRDDDGQPPLTAGGAPDPRMAQALFSPEWTEGDWVLWPRERAVLVRYEEE